MEISKNRMDNQRRNVRLRFDEFEASSDRKLKTADKARKNRELFLKGLEWFHSDKSLAEASIDDICFKRGYEEGLYELGFRCGYEYKSCDDMSKDFTEHFKFKDGYRDGEEKRLIDDSKKEAKGRR